MRIVLACPYAWDAPGGVQVHVRSLARHLRSRGHEVLVLAPGRGRADQPWVQLVGTPIRVRYQGTVAPIAFSPASFRRVGEAMRRFQPDVVHAHEPLSPSTAMAAALRARVPTVATFHAFAERSALLSLAAPFLRPVWRRLTIRLAVSEAAAGFVRSRFGDGIRVVPNGCDVERFATSEPASGLPSGRRVLWVGRLDPQKGFRVAVRAFGLLASEVPDLTFVVAGDGRDRGAVLDLRPEVRARVVMLGAVPHDRLAPFHRAADAFVSPALGQESFGMVLVEAMAAGLPIVASDIAGYREVVRDGVEGLLVPAGDPEAVAAALRRVLSEPDLAGRLREGGRVRAGDFRWEVVVDRVEQAYQEAVSR